MMIPATVRLPSARFTAAALLIGLPAVLYTYIPRPPVAGSQFLAYPVMGGVLFLVLATLLRERPVVSREIIGWLLLLVGYGVVTGISFLANAAELRGSAPAELFKPTVYAIFLVYGYTVARSAPAPAVARGLVWAALLILAGQAVLGLTQVVGAPVFHPLYDAGKSHPFGRLMRVTGSLANPNAFAWMVAQAAVIVSLMHPRRTRYLWLALATILVVLSGSRTLLVLFPFMIVAAQILRDPGNLRVYARYLTFGAGVVALFIGVIFYLAEFFPYLAQLANIASSGSLTSVGSFAARINIWTRGYEEFTEGGPLALIIGLGARQSTAILDNDYLYVLFRVGVLGAIVHFGMILAVLREFLRARGDSVGALGAQYVLFSLAFGMLSETTASWQVPLIMFALLGIVLGTKERRHVVAPSLPIRIR